MEDVIIAVLSAMFGGFIAVLIMSCFLINRGADDDEKIDDRQLELNQSNFERERKENEQIGCKKISSRN